MASAYFPALKATLPCSFTLSARLVVSSSGSGDDSGDGGFSVFGLVMGDGVLDPAPGLAPSARLDASIMS